MRALVVISLAFALAFAPAAQAHTLGYSQAKRAAQRKADAIAGKRTQITSLLRGSRHIYYAAARWRFTDTTGTFGTVGGPVRCSLLLKVKFRSSSSSRVQVLVDSKTCS